MIILQTHAYWKYKTPHPSPISSDWLSEDLDGDKAKRREQRLLIDLNFPKVEQKQMTDLDILKELPTQNLDIQEDRQEEEKLPEITDSLVLPSEVAAAMPTTEKIEKTEVTEWENIIEEKDIEELTEQELRLQKDKEEYFIYIAGISKEEESNIQTDSEESTYFF